MSFEKVDEILEGYGHRHDALIGMFRTFSVWKITCPWKRCNTLVVS